MPLHYFTLTSATLGKISHKKHLFSACLMVATEGALYTTNYLCAVNPYKNTAVNQAFTGLCQSAYSTIWLVKNGHIETHKKLIPV